MTRSLQISVAAANALEFKADVLALKFAQHLKFFLMFPQCAIPSSGLGQRLECRDAVSEFVFQGLDRRPPRSIDALLSIEGRAAFSYFNAWQSLPLQWKGIGRYPVPDDWHRVGPRTSGKNKIGQNRNATHPVNAILNYAYAVLESQVRMQIIAEGYDPTVGFLHSHNPDRPALVSI